MSRLTLIGTGLISLVVSGNTMAQVEYHYATVVESHPIIRVVEISTPQEQCWEEEYQVQRDYGGSSSNTTAVLGTIIGGAIGNAVGHNKSNKRVGAVLGAVLGHSIGRDIIRQQDRQYVGGVEVVQRCKTVYERHEEERIVGYQVTYNYNGQDYNVRTDSDPGDQIRVRVSVQPVL